MNFYVVPFQSLDTHNLNEIELYCKSFLLKADKFYVAIRMEIVASTSKKVLGSQEICSWYLGQNLNSCLEKV